MPTILTHRSVLASAILLTALLAGCRDEPAPNPDARATKVPAKQDKPADKPADKPEPSAVVSAKPSAVVPAKPAPEMPSAAASASAVASASAAPEAPAPPPDPSVDCDKLLSMQDVFDACKIKVEAPKDQPTDNIGLETRCVRRFESKDAGLLTMIVVRHASDAEAQERYSADFKLELSKPDVVEGAGQFARFYLKKGVGDNPILTSEAVKGRFNVTLFNPKVTVGGQTVGPVCEEKALGKLLVKALGNIP